MNDNIMKIFEQNKRLLAQVDKAVFCFREEEYDSALAFLAQEMDSIRAMTDAVLQDREYFELVSTDSVIEMLSGILKAKKSGDYTLLADLLELQLANFICNVQEMIVQREDFCAYDPQIDEQNVEIMSGKLPDAKAKELLLEPIIPEELLALDYRVEFTHCGEMTLAVPTPEGQSYYLHSNHRVSSEAFLLARKWTRKEGRRYLVFGFGMGYVIRELLPLIPEDAVVEVYEQDIHVLRLACAFSDVAGWLSDARVLLHCDPTCEQFQKRLLERKSDEVICIHYPSYCHCGNASAREKMKEFMPGMKLLSEC